MNAPQQSGAWLNQRVGKLTASRMAAAMDFLKNGKPGADRVNLMRELLAERLTGDAVPHFVNSFMLWGIEKEPEAKAEFETRTGTLLMPCGFIEHPTIEFFGGSPDALIDADAVFEAKCPQTTTHVKWIEDGQIPDQHKPQILAQLACTRRRRAVFASFDPRIPGRQRLFIREWEPSADEIAAVEQAAVEFLRELDQRFQNLVESM